MGLTIRQVDVKIYASTPLQNSHTLHWMLGFAKSDMKFQKEFLRVMAIRYPKLVEGDDSNEATAN